MASSNEASFLISLSISIALMTGMQIYKTYLSSSQLMTIFGGYLGSLVFIFLLTAVSNLEMSLFGKNFQSKLFEVILTLLIALIVSASIHRVCITCCLLFSLTGLYFVNKISNRKNTTSAPVTHLLQSSKKRR